VKSVPFDFKITLLFFKVFFNLEIHPNNTFTYVQKIVLNHQKINLKYNK